MVEPRGLEPLTPCLQRAPMVPKAGDGLTEPTLCGCPMSPGECRVLSPNLSPSQPPASGSSLGDLGALAMRGGDTLRRRGDSGAQEVVGVRVTGGQRPSR